jgi:bifunctional non-homologous end joining protein LigD
MLQKGDLKFRLDGQKLKGEFALVHIKSRRPDSKGTEWLLIKHRDAYVQSGYDIDQYDYSVLTKRSLKQIAGDAGSAEWLSSRKATRGGSAKNDWLADSIAKADAKKDSAVKKTQPSTSSGRASGKKTLSGAPATNKEPTKKATTKTIASTKSAAVKKKSRVEQTA